MSWTNTQKQIYAAACRSAGISDEHRRLILGQCDGRAVHQGRATSTSPRLTQADFETCMAVVERSASGRIEIRRKDGVVTRSYRPGYWQEQADQGDTQRLRWIARQIDRELQQRCPSWTTASLPGWIQNRIPNSEHSNLDRLTHRQVTDLVQGLRAWARRHAIELAA